MRVEADFVGLSLSESYACGKYFQLHLTLYPKTSSAKTTLKKSRSVRIVTAGRRRSREENPTTNWHVIYRVSSTKLARIRKYAARLNYYFSK